MKIRKNEIITIIISYLTFILIGIPSGFLGVAWPSIQKNFNLSLDFVGQLLLVSTIFYTLASFISGQIVSRLGFWKYLIIFSAFNAIGLFGQFLSPSWVVLLLWTVAAGFGTGGLDSGVNIFIGTRYRATLVNWLHACFGIGATVGPAFMALLNQSGLSWRIGYLSISIAQAALMVGVVLSRKVWTVAKPVSADGKAQTPESRPSLVSTLMVPAVWLGMLFFFVYTGAEITAGQWAYSLFTLGRHLPEATAGFWTSMYWGSFTVGRMFLGFFVDRYGVSRVLRICMLAAIGGALLLWWAPFPLIGFLGLGVIGMAFAPVFPTLIANTSQWIGAAHAPNAIGLQIGLAGIGYAALPGLAGIAANIAGISVIAPYLLGANILMLLVFEALILAKIKGKAIATRVENQPS